MTIEAIQGELIDIGLLDPPADGVFGPVTAWALRTAGIKDTPTVEHHDAILKKLAAKKEALPLKPGNDLAGRIIKAMLAKQYFVACHHSCLNIVYIEGMDPDGKANKNIPNQFNDLRVVIRIDHGVPKIAGKWEATTEPGKYFTERPMNPNGAARIKFGQWKCWSRGVHNKHHEALVQTRELEVYRDSMKKYQRYGQTYRGLFGINQHHGYNLKLHDLARSSAGCLVGRTTAGHSAFMALVKSDARYKASGGSYRFITTVMPASDVP